MIDPKGETTPPPRDIKFNCRFCDKSFTEPVQWGCYVQMEEGVSVSLLQEQPGLIDLYLGTIVCATCGCCSGLSFSKG